MNTVRYIWHDCFVVTTPEVVMIFDFWKSPADIKEIEPGFLREIPDSKPVYVLVSHHHKDHFNRVIFEWESLHPNIKFILSKDTARISRKVWDVSSIYRGKKVSDKKICILQSGEEFCDSFLKVKAYPSTDIGNSYVVSTSSLKIFHAGDLNAWLWKDESTEKEVEEALSAFVSVLNEISKYEHRFDIAMFPVDSRIGSDYYSGAKIFVRKFEVRYFFPMHYGLGDEKECLLRFMDATRLALYANEKWGDYIAFQSAYSMFGFK